MSNPFRPVSAMTTADAEPAFTEVFGLPASMQYFFGSLRSADGRYFWPIRGSYREQARHLHLSEAKFTGPRDMPATVSDFAFVVEAAGAYEGAVTWAPTASGGWAINRADGRPPLVATDNASLAWIEDDKLALRGTQRGVGVQFRVPNTEWPFMYSSRLFKVDTGQIDGSDVTGWVFHDTLHLPAGENFMTSPYQRRLQAAWVAFVTEYADGQIHSGHLVYGLEGFCALIVHRSDGPPVIANEVDLVVETDDEDFPTRISFTGAGEAWEWNVYPGGARMPIRADVGGDHRWTQGVVRRVGEVRDVVSAEALMETYQDRLRDVIVG